LASRSAITLHHESLRQLDWLLTHLFNFYDEAQERKTRQRELAGEGVILVSEKRHYRKLPWICDIVQSQYRERSISTYRCCTFDLVARTAYPARTKSMIDGTPMGRKPKTTGPTARDPGAFKSVLVRMNIEGWRALKVLAAEQEATLNALAVEAFNDLLKKHGKRQSVGNPLLDNRSS
jgi:antitoxin-like ribbon-helix-helix protein